MLSPLLSPPPSTTRSQTVTEVEHPYHRKRPSICSHPSPSRTANLESYSFDILRPDPSTSSLEHVAHSNTFRNRGCTISHQGSSIGIANGSAPVFKVTPSQHIPVSGTQQEIQPVSGNAGRNTCVCPSGTNNVLAGYSSVITFPVSGSTTNANTDFRRRTVVSDDDTYPHERGKKHRCHICSKRFNRPSSLRIHVNTHTGATRIVHLSLITQEY
jgi:hypothetical protein